MIRKEEELIMESTCAFCHTLCSPQDGEYQLVNDDYSCLGISEKFICYKCCPKGERECYI